MTCCLLPDRSSEWTGCIDPIQWPKAAASKNVSNQNLLVCAQVSSCWKHCISVYTVHLFPLYSKLNSIYMPFRNLRIDPAVYLLCSVCMVHKLEREPTFLLYRKLYVVLSVVLCLLASSLVAFFLFPRSMVVVDDGIHSVTVHFDYSNMKVLMNMTVGFFSPWLILSFQFIGYT